MAATPFRISSSGRCEGDVGNKMGVTNSEKLHVFVSLLLDVWYSGHSYKSSLRRVLSTESFEC